MTETQKNPLAESFNALSLIRFAFPSMVMMLFMGLYTIVDTIFVARFVDTNALSSINIVCPVINLIVGLGTMLATGGSAVVAKKMGNGNTEEAASAEPNWNAATELPLTEGRGRYCQKEVSCTFAGLKWTYLFC